MPPITVCMCVSGKVNHNRSLKLIELLMPQYPGNIFNKLQTIQKLVVKCYLVLSILVNTVSWECLGAVTHEFMHGNEKKYYVKMI